MEATISRRKLWIMERVIGRPEDIERPYRGVDWKIAVNRFMQPGFTYPEYYKKNFHGVAGGYLNIGAAITYDPVTSRIVIPGENRVRQAYVSYVKSKLGNLVPQRILDLGAGTASSTLYWSQAFPQAEVVGIDLSPWMLVAAECKLAGVGQAAKNVRLLQGNAEATNFEAGSFDIVTASFLFHELPTAAAQQVVNEAMRILKPGGLFTMWDGNQCGNFLVKTIGSYFPEPYLVEYMGGNMAQMCQNAGFAAPNIKRHLQLYQFFCASRS